MSLLGLSFQGPIRHEAAISVHRFASSTPSPPESFQHWILVPLPKEVTHRTHNTTFPAVTPVGLQLLRLLHRLRAVIYASVLPQVSAAR